MLKVEEEICDIAGGVRGGLWGPSPPGIVVLGSILGSGGMELGATGHSITCSCSGTASWQNEAEEGYSVDFPSWKTCRHVLMPFPSGFLPGSTSVLPLG